MTDPKPEYGYLTRKGSLPGPRREGDEYWNILQERWAEMGSTEFSNNTFYRRPTPPKPAVEVALEKYPTANYDWTAGFRKGWEEKI